MLNFDYPGKKLTEAEQDTILITEGISSEVGLFFADLDSERLYTETIRLRDALRMTDPDNKDFLILAHPAIHWDAWDRVRFENPNWERMSRSAWDVPPRGRVVMEYSPKDKKNKFYVYADPRLNTDHWKDSIMSKFSLADDTTVFKFTRKI